MFAGTILFLDRNDINTDEIIPARYLTEIYRKDLKDHLFEDLNMDGFSLEQLSDKRMVITRDNFGCGSSREHAPWALEVNDIRTVVASGYARIFRQNMFNGGMLPIQLSAEDIDDLFTTFSNAEAEGVADPAAGTLIVKGSGTEKEYRFELSKFHAELISVGGWVEYANQNY